MLESKLLAKYEKDVLQKVSGVLPVSKKDAEKISLENTNINVNYLPVFLPFQEVNILEGIGDCCLYHGNLSIAENAEAVHWLVDNVDENFGKLIVAGKHLSASLRKFLKERDITLVADPSDAELFHLIQHAQINIVLSFNDTGIKLKLLNALFHGRHCVVNEEAIPGSEFEKFCTSFSSPKNFNEIISQLKNKPFTQMDIEARKNFLLSHFNNEMNAAKLNAIL